MAKISNRTEQHKKQVLQALEKSLGIVTQACKIANIGRTQFYTWLREDPEFAQAVKEVESIVLDFAESQLHKQINEGNTTATIFFLKTKGKNRGYIERQQIEVSDQRPDLSGLSTEELKAIVYDNDIDEEGTGA